MKLLTMHSSEGSMNFSMRTIHTYIHIYRNRQSLPSYSEPECIWQINWKLCKYQLALPLVVIVSSLPCQCSWLAFTTLRLFFFNALSSSRSQLRCNTVNTVCGWFSGRRTYILIARLSDKQYKAKGLDNNMQVSQWPLHIWALSKHNIHWQTCQSRMYFVHRTRRLMACYIASFPQASVSLKCTF